MVGIHRASSLVINCDDDCDDDNGRSHFCVWEGSHHGMDDDRDSEDSTRPLVAGGEGFTATDDSGKTADTDDSDPYIFPSA